MPKEPYTCPSSMCNKDAFLFGIVGPDGRVAYVSPPIQVDQAVLNVVNATDGTAEQRFRFASPCVEERCAQWANGKCGVIDPALSTPITVDDDSSLPACGIRKTCRWFRQSGSSACKVCPLIITKIS
jgi:hypothetical protein